MTVGWLNVTGLAVEAVGLAVTDWGIAKTYKARTCWRAVLQAGAVVVSLEKLALSGDPSRSVTDRSQITCGSSRSDWSVGGVAKKADCADHDNTHCCHDPPEVVAALNPFRRLLIVHRGLS